MTALTQTRPRSRAAAGGLAPAARAAGLWALPFALVLYLGLRGGGYDPLVRNDVGIAIWWIVLLGAAVGVLPAARLRFAGWVALGLFAAFTVWTGLSTGWSVSAERSAADLGKMATYLGFFVLALSVHGSDGRRHVISGAAAAAAAIGGVAVLSRLHPAWFPANPIAELSPSNARRLAYPLNYWNALSTLMAMGVPLLLHVATSARTYPGRMLAAAAVPVVVLCAWLTVSRGTAVWLPAGMVAYLLLAPNRLARAPTLAITALGSGLLVAAVEQRDALQTGLVTAASSAQGNSMLVMVALVCAAVALLQLAAGATLAHIAVATPSRRATSAGTAVALILVAAGLVAAHVPSRAGDDWQRFKAPVAPTAANDGVSAFTRLQSLSGNGRYQFWQSASDQASVSSLKGTGADTFEYWWAQHGSVAAFVRDTHSLYLQTLGELGWVGLALLGGWLLFVLAAGIVIAMRTRDSEHRGLVAAATGGLVAFAVAGAFEWVWQIAVIPALVAVLAGVVLGARGESQPRPARPWARGLIAVLAAAGLITAAVTVAGADAVRTSQQLAQRGDLAGAYAKASDAVTAAPYAASPRLQQALVLERLGDLRGAERAALAAVHREPTNWRNELVLSRVRARRGDAAGAVAAYRRARALNPRSPLFRKR